jgi:PBP1b-binding outer membrane lipoprotein LpoB
MQLIAIETVHISDQINVAHLRVAMQEFVNKKKGRNAVELLQYVINKNLRLTSNLKLVVVLKAAVLSLVSRQLFSCST